MAAIGEQQSIIERTRREAQALRGWLYVVAHGQWQRVTSDEERGFSVEQMGLAVRWLGVIAVLLLSLFIGHIQRDRFDLPSPAVAGIIVAYNLLITFYLISRHNYASRRVMFAVMTLDWLAAALAVMLTGRSHSVFFILFFTLVITAAAQFGLLISLGYVAATFGFSAALYWLGLEASDLPLLGILSVYINALGLAAFATVALRQALYAEAERSRQERGRAADIARREQMERDFLSIVSHELRSPLTAMKTSISALQSVANRPEAESKLLANVNRSNERLIALVNDLLDVSRLQAGRLTVNMAPTDMCEVVAEAAAMVRPLTEAKGQELRVHLPDQPLYVLGDRRRLEQALLNLLFNANKFTASSGHISLGLRRGIGLSGGEQALVQVRDDGLGMSAEQQEHIFERFYSFSQIEPDKLATQKRSGEGLGLGLAIARSLVELHGGQMGVQSRLGWGSLFYLWLPTCPPDGCEVKAEDLE